MSSLNTDASLKDGKEQPTYAGGSDTEKAVVSEPAPAMDFPDGGPRAWMVALGAGGVLFCTFGYVNAFG